MVTGQHAPQRGMFLSVACSPAWHAPQCGIFLSRSLWSCSVWLCTQRRCNAYWLWRGRTHIRESRGMNVWCCQDTRKVPNANEAFGRWLHVG